MTAAELVNAALKRIEVLAAGETPTSEDETDALLRLNDLVDAWATERLTMFTVTRTTWTIVANTQTYSVGSGGTVNIVRPSLPWELDVRFQDTAQSPTLELPLTMLTESAYEAIPVKTQTATYPTSYYYNPTFGSTARGTLTLWPNPTSGTLQGVIYAPTAVTEFALTDTIYLPAGYRRALRENLALELWPEFCGAREIPSYLLASATESKAAIKRVNQQLSDLAIDLAVLPGWMQMPRNIYTDT